MYMNIDFITMYMNTDFITMYTNTDRIYNDVHEHRLTL